MAFAGGAASAKFVVGHFGISAKLSHPYIGKVKRTVESCMSDVLVGASELVVQKLRN